MTFNTLCVISLAAAAVLNGENKHVPGGSSLEKFEADMKKKWDSILEKHPIDLASTTDAPEVLAAPTTNPEDHILDSLKALDATTATPTLFASFDDDFKVPSTTVAPLPDIDAELAKLKAKLHEDDAVSTIAPLAEADTTIAPLAAAEPTADVSELLANLHKHIHDVHSSVHDALDGSLNHPAIKPAMESLDSSSDDTTKDKLQDLIMHPPADEDGVEDSEAPVPKADAEADAAVPDAPDAIVEEKTDAQKAAAMQGMKRLMGAVKMIVMLQPMLEPLKEKLTLALEHMAPGDAKKANAILKHIKVLGVYSKVTAGLMAGVIAAKKGTPEDREKAIATLIVGVKQIQDKVAKHLMEMKQETLALPHGDAAGAEDAEPADGADAAAPEEGEEPTEHAKHAEVAMDKMTALLVKLGKKIATEIKDPANRHNPKVLLDIKLFLAVKDSVEKTQALMMAGSIAIKKAKSEEEKAAVQAAVKKGMSKVEATLKEKMMALEKQALLLAVASAKQQEQAEKGHATEGEDEADAVADDKKSEKKAEGDDDEETPKKEEGDADEEEAEEAEDKPEEKKAKAAKAPQSKKGKKAKAAKAKGDDDDAGEEEQPEGGEEEQGEEAPPEESSDDKEPASDGEGEEESADDAEEKAKSKTSSVAAAKKNHPEISDSDIENIFAQAADDATDAKPESLAEVHLRATTK